MSQLEELKRRVERAEQQFRLAAEQHRKSGERLGGVAGAVEGGLRESNAEIERLRTENQQLGDMLSSILDLIDSTGDDRIETAVAELDRKVREMFQHGAQEASAEEAEEPPKIFTASRSRAGAARPEDGTGDESERLTSVKGVLKGMLEEMNAVSVDESTAATVTPVNLASSDSSSADAEPETPADEAEPEDAGRLDSSVTKKVRDALSKIDRSR